MVSVRFRGRVVSKRSVSQTGWISRESRSAAPTAEISHTLIGYEGQIHWTEIVQQKSSVQQDIIFTDIIYTCWDDVYVTRGAWRSFFLLTKSTAERTAAVIDYGLSEHVYLCRIRVIIVYHCVLLQSELTPPISPNGQIAPKLPQWNPPKGWKTFEHF